MTIYGDFGRTLQAERHPARCNSVRCPCYVEGIEDQVFRQDRLRADAQMAEEREALASEMELEWQRKQK